MSGAYGGATTKPKKSKPTKGKDQAKGGTYGKQHTDFRTYYHTDEQPLDLWKTNLRFVARTAQGDIPLSSLVQTATWQDQSADNLANVNTQVPLTGSVVLTKPALTQYNKLLPPALSARIEDAGRIPRLGALGVVVICSVGYGRHYVPLWAMRVVPGDSGGGGTSGGSGTEEVDLTSGQWTLNLSDDLWLLSQSQDDFKFTKGRKHRRQGWRAHEIAAQVCAKYKIPVRHLAHGTSYFELPTSEVTATSPIAVINAAYAKEASSTGRTFVIRWGAPDRKHPFGALEVTPLRRNPTLFVFRNQLIDAVLGRSQSPDFATVIEGRGKLKDPHGKHQSITYVAKNEQAIRRYGWVFKIVDFGSVSSALELQVIAKRALATRLVPIRGAELTHPGIPTLRRGDAIRINIPEEGYAPVSLSPIGTPRMPPDRGRTKRSAQALQQAEKDDPAMFGLPDPSLLSATGSQTLAQQAQVPDSSTTTTAALTKNLPVVLPVADQGIAFVTSVTHTVSQGSYTVDIQTGFVDVLDPMEVQAQIDQAARKAKEAAAAAAKKAAAPAGSGSGQWITVKATYFTDTTYACGGSPSTNGGMFFAELNGGSIPSGPTSMSSPGLGPMFGYPHGLPCGYRLEIQFGGRSIVAIKQDIGSGAPGAKIDLYQALSDALGFTSLGAGNVQIRAA